MTKTPEDVLVDIIVRTQSDNAAISKELQVYRTALDEIVTYDFYGAEHSMLTIVNAICAVKRIASSAIARGGFVRENYAEVSIDAA